MKNHGKIEFFYFLKIGPNVKIWTQGCEFRPKKHIFAQFFRKTKISPPKGRYTGQNPLSDTT